MNQPKQCERCGDYLSTNGIPCTLDSCEYFKFDDTADYSDDDVGDAEDIVLFSQNQKKTKKGDEEDDDDDGFLDSVGDAIEEVSDGCIWGTIKFIWKVITLPFRLIWRLFEFFDD